MQRRFEARVAVVLLYWMANWFSLSAFRFLPTFFEGFVAVVDDVCASFNIGATFRGPRLIACVRASSNSKTGHCFLAGPWPPTELETGSVVGHATDELWQFNVLVIGDHELYTRIPFPLLIFRILLGFPSFSHFKGALTACCSSLSKVMIL